MGLAGPKNRTKLSHDPNNTRWTTNKSSFGHKIMASQGWSEGQYLGAVDANHAEHYTAANASHIRVQIKDDTLGLGAKRGSGVAAGECTGLDAFKDLLGRLNGKEEDEIAREQRSRAELKRAIYGERKWGSQRFVSGGFLVGDKILELVEGEKERLRALEEGGSSSSSDSSSEEESEVEQDSSEVVEKSKRKRKLENDDEAESSEPKSKKSKKRKLEDTKAELVAVKSTKPKKEKKRRAAKIRDEDEPESDITDEKAEKRRRKEEKRARKAKKEEEKALKKAKKDKRKSTLGNISESSVPTTPAPGSGVSTPVMLHGRHAVRARQIAQKRMASMDVAALNQIFMIKTPS